MNINKERVRKQFNRHAHEYDQYAQVQQQMADQLFDHITGAEPSSVGYQNILEIGCGTGYLTEKLVHQYPEANIVVVDLAERMIALTKQRLAGRTTKLTTMIEDAERLVLAKKGLETLHTSFDLIVSNATFQWFNDAQATVQAHLKLLTSSGILAFSTFGPHTFQELHTSFAFAEKQLGLPPQQHGQTFHNIQRWNDFISPYAQPIHVFEQRRIEVYPTVKDFLYQVKKMGAGNATLSQQQNHLGVKKLMNLMEQTYVQNYSVVGGVQATYHLYMGLYKKM